MNNLKNIKSLNNSQTTFPEPHKREMQAIEDTLYVISGKWKFPIITALCHEELRYSELEKRIPKITPRMLSKELKELELNNLIERKVYDTIPVRVTYKRTEFSTTLLTVITELIKWGIAHREKIMNIKREDNKV
ncbi:MAG: helix-turn-helix domain-containing protein [Bacteroidota bacterium]